MKKIIALLLPLLIVVGLAAFEVELGGEFRSRAAMYNDTDEDNGGHIDNRLLLNMTGRLYPNWNLVYGAEIGDIVWGGAGGGIATRGVNIETAELYIEHNWVAKNMKFKIGQQYWADHRSMILDDPFSGALVEIGDLGGMRAELAYMKPMERRWDINDDYHVGMFSLYLDRLNAGLHSFYGNDLKQNDMANFTVMPFITLPAGPVELDATLFVDYQVVPGDDQMGFGAAFKADANMGNAGIGADLLYIGENGLTVLSPYYQNGLYLFGWGKWNDSVTTAFPYPDGNDGLLSAVGQVHYQVSPKMKAFANAGYVTTMANNDPGVGFELNAGVEYDLFRDKIKMAMFGAFGSPGEGIDNDPNTLYLLGTTLKAEF